MIGAVDLDDLSGQRPGALPVPEPVSGAADQRHGPVARRSAATVGSSVSNGVNHTAARPRSAATGPASDPSDFPMTTGAAPVAAVISSAADSTWNATRRRCRPKSEPRGSSYAIGRTSPPRRSTASLAYISNGPVASTPAIMACTSATPTSGLTPPDRCRVSRPYTTRGAIPRFRTFNIKTVGMTPLRVS